MASRIVRPETVKIDISQGDWLLVKRRLNAGESRRVFERQVKLAPIGERPKLDPTQVGRSQAMEYLIDWSLSDLPIRDKSPDEIGDALDTIDLESFKEIVAAIQAHELRVDAELEAAKNVRDGGSKLPATLPSVA